MSGPGQQSRHTFLRFLAPVVLLAIALGIGVETHRLERQSKTPYPVVRPF